eukprot:scaffold4740_cov165-Amphora_coffeaeformis.AAC.14
MSRENEHIEASGADPSVSDANTDANEIDRGQESQRGSPVSSEGSNASGGRPRSATHGSSVASAPQSSATPSQTLHQETISGIAVLAEGAIKQPAYNTPAKKPKESGEVPGGCERKPSRSVSQEKYEVPAGAAAVANNSPGPETTPAGSYQSSEDKRGHEQALPSSVQSAKSGPEQEAVDDEGTTQSTGASPTGASSGDGPPQFITTKPSGKKSSSMRRRGKWTVEEEAYVARVIQDFNSGFLDAPAGTTLRTFLSDKLNCDPMRITKKFTGEACIGKRVFHPAIRSPNNSTAIDKAQSELEQLEERWRRRLEMQQRESAKKAAASAAAAAAAASSAPHGGLMDPTRSAASENPILQTATWLDRAKSLTSLPSDNIKVLPRSEVMNQMAEVQKLLKEGSSMQRTRAELTHLVDQSAERADTTSGTESPPPEPADKRLRTGAEDAEALVGFLRSVRASAASGQGF